MITISNAKTLTALINTASAANTTRFAAQRGIFFDSMSDMVAKLNAEGLTMQQNDGEREIGRASCRERVFTEV